MISLLLGLTVDCLTYLRKTLSSYSGGRVVLLGIELCTLAKNTRENMGEDRPLPNIIVISERQAMFEATFGIGADQVGKSRNDQFPHIRSPLQGSHFLLSCQYTIDVCEWEGAFVICSHVAM
jgi:hypothetical protein